MSIEALQQGCEKEYSLKKIYNIYVKIAQAHFIYQPSKTKAIIAMPFDWLEVQNLLEDYLKKHGADFDALSKEYVSESAEDDYLPPAQPEPEELDFVQPHKKIDVRLEIGQPDRSLWFRIGEICVDESKGFISSGRAIEKIRELLREAERQEK